MCYNQAPKGTAAHRGAAACMAESDAAGAVCEGEMSAQGQHASSSKGAAPGWQPSAPRLSYSLSSQLFSLTVMQVSSDVQQLSCASVSLQGRVQQHRGSMHATCTKQVRKQFKRSSSRQVSFIAPAKFVTLVPSSLPAPQRLPALSVSDCAEKWKAGMGMLWQCRFV